MAMESHYFLVCDECKAPGPFGGSSAHAEELACKEGWNIFFLFREERGLHPMASCPRCIALRTARPTAMLNPLVVNEFDSGAAPTNARKPVAPSTRLLLEQWKRRAVA